MRFKKCGLGDDQTARVAHPFYFTRPRELRTYPRQCTPLCGEEQCYTKEQFRPDDIQKIKKTDRRCCLRSSLCREAEDPRRSLRLNISGFSWCSSAGGVRVFFSGWRACVARWRACVLQRVACESWTTDDVQKTAGLGMIFAGSKCFFQYESLFSVPWDTSGSIVSA